MPPLLKFAVMFEAQEAIFAPHVFGGMIRGALGKALRGINLAAYNALFEPEKRDDLGPRYDSPPVPYALDVRSPPGGLVQAGERFSVGVTLYGEASVLADYVVGAMARAGQCGFGKTRGRAALLGTQCVWRYDDYAGQPHDGAPLMLPEAPVMPNHARIVLTSPLRRKHMGTYMTHESFEAKPWIEAISSRIAILDAAYGDARDVVAGPTVPRIKTGERQMWWVEQYIWSAKQSTVRDLSGTAGNFRLPLTGLEQLWPAIWAGQWYQVGSGVTAGLGTYRVVSE